MRSENLYFQVISDHYQIHDWVQTRARRKTTINSDLSNLVRRERPRSPPPPTESRELSVLQSRAAAGFIRGEFLEECRWHGPGRRSVRYRCSAIVSPFPAPVHSRGEMSATSNFTGSVRVKYSCAADWIDFIVTSTGHQAGDIERPFFKSCRRPRAVRNEIMKNPPSSYVAAHPVHVPRQCHRWLYEPSSLMNTRDRSRPLKRGKKVQRIIHRNVCRVARRKNYETIYWNLHLKGKGSRI